MIKIIKYFIESIIIYLFFIIIKIIDLNLSRIIFSKIFNIIGPLFRSEKIINENLNKIFRQQDIDTNKRKKIISKMWANYGKTFVEYLFLNSFKNSNSHITIKNKEILEKLKRTNQPCIFVSGHFANFELMSMELVKEGFDLATIYRPLNNFFINPFMEYLRKNFVCRNQIKKGRSGTRDLINYADKKYSIALMVDQRLGEGEKLPFFNINALTTTLPAQLAFKYNLKIVPIYLSRNDSDHFEMEIKDPIVVDNKENNQFNKIQISLEINQAIEKMVSRDPGQWILTHNRWK